MSVIFTKGIFILIYKLQSAQHIRIPKPPFLPTCCSSTAAPMLSSSCMNRRLSRRNQSSCWGGCMFWRRRSAQKRCAIWRYQGPAIEPRRAPVLVGSPSYMMYLLYLYIYIQLYFIFSLVCPYATARKAEPAHRSARALREGAPRGGRVTPP